MYKTLAAIAPAVLAANDTMDSSGDFNAVTRLTVDGGQLWAVDVAVTERAAIGGEDEVIRSEPVVGLVDFEDVATWHPVTSEGVAWKRAKPSVAEVLVQLPDSLRRQVTGVEFHGWPFAILALPEGKCNGRDKWGIVPGATLARPPLGRVRSLAAVHAARRRV